jgi:hypothetical protein
MSKQISEKEMMLSMLAGVYDQLEELESVLESAFSDIRRNLINKEHVKIAKVKEKLMKLESKDLLNNSERIITKENRTMKLELGF